MGWQAVGLAATIFIRSYNNFGVPAPDLAVAREHAQAILQEAGVNVVWIDCWAGGRREPVDTVDRCQEPVGSDIVLRLLKTKVNDRSRFVSMGFSLVGIPGSHFSRPFTSTAPNRWLEAPASTHAACSDWRLRTRLATCCSTATRTRQAD